MVKAKSEFEGLAFGLADGVVCFLGILIGVAAATGSTSIVLIAGLVGGIADAFGNSVGFYISQAMERGIQTQKKIEKKRNIDVHSRGEIIMSAVYAFFSTIAVLLLLVTPFVMFDLTTASIASFGIGITLLFVLGVYVSGLVKENAVITGAEFAAIGVVGAGLSYFIGTQLKLLLSNGA